MLPEQQQRIMGYFIEEAKDHLNTIEQGLLNLQATIEDAEMANEVFRAAHSVKGGAAMLGLDSIQRTSHRMEDYFKILKESPVRVDRALETMFLQVFDALQDLLDQLQGPFGLTDDKAQEIMTGVEPVFGQISTHLDQLVAAGATSTPTPTPARPTAVPVATQRSSSAGHSEQSALALVFRSDVPGHLRDMLNLFKQADIGATRQQLQDLCDTLYRIGEQFELAPWCDLVKTARLAIGNSENSYRSLAPVVIKDLKKGQDLVVAGRSTEVTVSDPLQAMLPEDVLSLGDDGELDALLEGALDDTLGEPDLNDLFDSTADQIIDDLTFDEEVSTDTQGQEAEGLDGLDASSEDGDFDALFGEAGMAALDPEGVEIDDPRPAKSGPEVGTAELNSLADLFEGEGNDFSDAWQEETTTSEISLSADDSMDVDITSDFSDLLMADNENESTVAEAGDDLADLFGDTLLDAPEDTVVQPDTASDLVQVSIEVDLLDDSSSEGADVLALEQSADQPLQVDDSTSELDDFFSEEPVSTSPATADPSDDDIDDLFAIADEPVVQSVEDRVTSVETDFDDLLSITDAVDEDRAVAPEASDLADGGLDDIVPDVSLIDEDLGDPWGDDVPPSTADVGDLNDLLSSVEEMGLADEWSAEAEAQSTDDALADLFAPETEADAELDLSDLEVDTDGSVDSFDLSLGESANQGDATDDMSLDLGLDDLDATIDDAPDTMSESTDLDFDDLSFDDSIAPLEEGLDLDELTRDESVEVAEDSLDLDALLDESEPRPIEEDFNLDDLQMPDDTVTSTELGSEGGFDLEESLSGSTDDAVAELNFDELGLEDDLAADGVAAEPSLDFDDFDLGADPVSEAGDSETAEADFDLGDLDLEESDLGAVTQEDGLDADLNFVMDEQGAQSEAIAALESTDAAALDLDLGSFEVDEMSTLESDDLDLSELEASDTLDFEADLGLPDTPVDTVDGDLEDFNLDDLAPSDEATETPAAELDLELAFDSSEVSNASELDGFDADFESTAESPEASPEASLDDFDLDLTSSADADNTSVGDLDLDLAALEDPPESSEAGLGELDFDLEGDIVSSPSSLGDLDLDLGSPSEAVETSLDDFDLSLNDSDTSEEAPLADLELEDSMASFETSSTDLDFPEDLSLTDSTDELADLSPETVLDGEIATNVQPEVEDSSLDLGDAASALMADENGLDDFFDLAADEAEAAADNLDLSMADTLPEAEAASVDDADQGLNGLADFELESISDNSGDADLAIDLDMGEGLDAVTLGDTAVPEVADDLGDDFDDLDSLLDDDPGGIDLSQPDADLPLESMQAGDSAIDDNDDGFDDLEALLEDEGDDLAAVTSESSFDDLDALLDEGDDPVAVTSGFAEDNDLEDGEDEFGDLERLLEEADQSLGGGGQSSTMRRTAAQSGRRPSRRGGSGVLGDQTMRVSVKHLDNLSNLVGELVVNRNTLEQDQERLRQFLDNLLFQVQQLNDVGQRMRDLYERSLLESSLISSRQAYQMAGSNPNRQSSIADADSSHSTGATFDALEMDRFTGFHTLSQEMIELIVRVRESSSDIAYTIESADQVTRQFRQVTTQLQEGLNKARMVPFAQTADRLPRAVRDISMKFGKEARLVVEGRDTLIDKMILEQLYDPMTHLVNNAITHGIETPEERAAAGKGREGTITIRAFYQGNQTVIYVADDGAGINHNMVKRKAMQKGLITQKEARNMAVHEVYELLFHPGFSTRDQADDFAGRGVGMDVVRTYLAQIRGTITTDSEIGKGTSFTIRLPLTLSISKALSCVSNQARIAFPMDGVEDMLDVPQERVQVNDRGQSCILWRDTLLPFQPLSDLLNFNRTLGRGRVYGGNQDDEIISVVVLRSANTHIALQVDQVIGEQEIVIKQLEGPVPKPVGIAGATVLGDGRVMPIADVLELIDLSMGRVRREPSTSLWTQPEETPQPEDVAVPAKSEPTVLIVDDSITVRELLSMSFNKVGYRVEQARDGQEAWEKLRSGLPCDLVFCDIEMPRMDGLELLSRMQKDANLSKIPIAMLTSRGADRHRQMAVDLGANGYFTKPYLEEALLDAAQRMLNGEMLVGKKTGTPESNGN